MIAKSICSTGKLQGEFKELTSQVSQARGVSAHFWWFTVYPKCLACGWTWQPSVGKKQMPIHICENYEMKI